MKTQGRPPRLTPDGKPQEPRRTGDESKNSPIDEVQDPEIAVDEDRGYANTDEVTPNEHGLVRRG
jgi:hypothetical protein